MFLQRVHSNHEVKCSKLQCFLVITERDCSGQEQMKDIILERKRQREGATAALGTQNVCHYDIAGWERDFSLYVHKTSTAVAITPL